MVEKSTTSNQKLSEALELVNEAAVEKREDLRRMISGKYEHIREALNGSNIKDSIDTAKKSAADAACRAKEVSEEKVKEIATQVDQNVHANPWPYIGGTALAALLLGFILGKKD